MAITGGGGGREKYNKEYKGMKKEKKSGRRCQGRKWKRESRITDKIKRGGGGDGN